MDKQKQTADDNFGASQSECPAGNEDAHMRPVESPTPQQPPWRVLVVDDEEINRNMMSDVLTMAGYEVKCAKNGREGIDAFEQWQPQVILMDISMPVMDGCEAIRCIKSTPQGQKITIIAVTANTSMEGRRAAMTAGADDFLGKPFRYHALLKMIQDHLPNPGA